MLGGLLASEAEHGFGAAARVACQLLIHPGTRQPYPSRQGEERFAFTGLLGDGSGEREAGPVPSSKPTSPLAVAPPRARVRFSDSRVRNPGVSRVRSFWSPEGDSIPRLSPGCLGVPCLYMRRSNLHLRCHMASSSVSQWTLSWI